jgi:uncharacterized protein
MRIGIVLLLAVWLTGCVAPSVDAVRKTDDSQQLMVRGEGRVEALPDLLQLRLGVVTEGSEADLTLQENNQRMAAVMAQLAELGIREEEMASGQFQIRPQWSLPPRPTPANWQRQIVGYQVSNELLIATRSVELAGRLLVAAQQAGANQAGGLQFTLADPEEHRQRAIVLATEQAVREARTLAQAAGVGLGPLQSATLENSNDGPRPQLMLAEVRTASSDTVPLATGRVEVTAAVVLVYRLQQN